MANGRNGSDVNETKYLRPRPK